MINLLWLLLLSVPYILSMEHSGIVKSPSIEDLSHIDIITNTTGQHHLQRTGSEDFIFHNLKPARASSLEYSRDNFRKSLSEDDRMLRFYRAVITEHDALYLDLKKHFDSSFELQQKVINNIISTTKFANKYDSDRKYIILSSSVAGCILIVLLVLEIVRLVK